MTRARGSVVSIAVLAVLAGVVPRAQGQPAAADAKAIANYRLTLDGVRKTTAANVALLKATRADPALAAKLSRDENTYQTLDAMVKQIESLAPVAAALKAAGITPRDYMLTQIAAVQAQMTAEMKKSGMAKDPVSAAMNDNIAFVAAHPAEIKALQESAEKLSGES